MRLMSLLGSSSLISFPLNPLTAISTVRRMLNRSLVLTNETASLQSIPLFLAMSAASLLLIFCVMILRDPQITVSIDTCVRPDNPFCQGILVLQPLVLYFKLVTLCHKPKVFGLLCQNFLLVSYNFRYRRYHCRQYSLNKKLSAQLSNIYGSWFSVSCCSKLF